MFILWPDFYVYAVAFARLRFSSKYAIHLIHNRKKKRKKSKKENENNAVKACDNKRGAGTANKETLKSFGSAKENH